MSESRINYPYRRDRIDWKSRSNYAVFGFICLAAWGSVLLLLQLCKLDILPHKPNWKGEPGLFWETANVVIPLAVALQIGETQDGCTLLVWQIMNKVVVFFAIAPGAVLRLQTFRIILWLFVMAIIFLAWKCSMSFCFNLCPLPDDMSPTVKAILEALTKPAMVKHTAAVLIGALVSMVIVCVQRYSLDGDSIIAEIIVRLAALECVLLAWLPRRIDILLTGRLNYHSLGEPVGDSTCGRGPIDAILDIVNRPDVIVHFPDGITVNQAVFGVDVCSPCLVRALPNATVSRLVDMIHVNRLTVRNLNISVLDEEMKLALRLFTANDPYDLFSTVNYPFKQRERTRESVLNTLGLVKILISAIRTLARDRTFVFRGNTYRGTYIAASNPGLRYKWDNHTIYFATGNVLHFAPVMSTSISRNQAEQFCTGAGKYNIMYVFENVVGVRIEQLSHFGIENGENNEQEVLWCPPSAFRIRYTEIDAGCLVIYLTRVCTSLEDKKNFTYWRLSDELMEESEVG
jgi:hypothetical protein